MDAITDVERLQRTYDKQYEHLQVLYTLYNTKYVETKKQRTKSAKELAKDIVQQEGIVEGLQIALNIFDPLPF